MTSPLPMNHPFPDCPKCTHLRLCTEHLEHPVTKLAQSWVNGILETHRHLKVDIEFHVMTDLGNFVHDTDPEARTQAKYMIDKGASRVEIEPRVTMIREAHR